MREDGSLEEIASKRNFRFKIRHAKVFGTPRQPTGAHLDPTFKEEDEDAIPMDLYPEQGSAVVTLPPQILVLTLESRDLLFLFAQTNETSNVRFITVTHPLPAMHSSLEQPGKYIAVDPR